MTFADVLLPFIYGGDILVVWIVEWDSLNR